MKSSPTKISYLALCFVVSLLIFACSKDLDVLTATVLDDPIATVEESESTETSETTETTETSETEDTAQDEDTQTQMEDGFESRTTAFPPLHDAHVQSGKGYDQQIIRLDEDNRISYLMFDLSAIDSIGGYITDAAFEFTVNSDEGNGTINIYKGITSDWTEDNLNEITAPEIDIFLGSIIKEYKLGATEEVVLNASDMVPEITSLILEHKDGNDLAIASKEHPSKIWPKLVVSYNAPEEADEIVVSEPTQEDQSNNEDTDNSGDNDNTGNSDDTDNTGNEDDTNGTGGEDSQDDTPQNTEPIAIADGTPSSGGAPLEVTFIGSNSTDDKEISSYHWDFKDGSSSANTNPVHTFTEVGTYEVELTVTDAEGLTNTDTVTITVTEEENQAPKAVAGATPLSGEAPLEVTFTGSNSTDDHGIASYLWGFKDGTTSSNANPVHTFTAVGTYAVELTVTDENGLSDKMTVTITVEEPSNEAPVAVAGATPTTGEAPLQVQFVGTNSTDDKAITSYYWDFANDPSSLANPVRTFNSPGVYVVQLTVTDAEGLSSNATVTITVNEGSGGNNGGNTGGGNAPPGYYVTPNGSPYNDGLSEASAWSMAHAYKTAQGGDIVYIKAGTYNGLQLSRFDFGNNQPIKFIGYTNTPGDIVANNGSTFKYGDNVNPNKMPLFVSNSPGSGKAFLNHEDYIEFHNIQIKGYAHGIDSYGDNFVLNNVITYEMGNQNSSGGGRGILIRGNNNVIENCFDYNSTSQGITLHGATNATVRHTSVYNDNTVNPGGYYLLLTAGASNTLVENCVVWRKTGLGHGGHGFVLKDLATNNTLRNNKVYNTGIEVNFSGVQNNTITDCEIYGSYSSNANEFSSSIRILNGAHHNKFQNIYVEDSQYVVTFHDYDDGYVGSGGDRDMVQGGSNNEFINIIGNKSNAAVRFATDGAGTSAYSNNNSFYNCTFYNIAGSPFTSSQSVSNLKFINCVFDNIPYYNFGNMSPTFENCNFSNTGFPIPNGNSITYHQPRFVNPAGKNFKLQGTSGLINIGKNTSYNKDFDGKTRASGSFDLGAYEY